jgi:hypothetical protein
MTTALILVTILVAGVMPQVRSGEDVVRAMYERFAGKWYDNLALVQTVTYYDSQTGAFDSARVWYESIQLPGVVRSDIAPLDAGNSVLFKEDTWIEFRADTVFRELPGPHPLLLLGFDVYVQAVEGTIAKLQSLGFDLSQLGEDEWQGRPAYVIGNEDRQFWIDREDLLFVRLQLKNPNTGAEREILFEGYERLGAGWIATEIKFMRDGRVDMFERYDYWTIDVGFEPSLFATEGRSRPAWVRN